MTVKAMAELVESLTAEERREFADLLADQVAVDEPPVLTDEMKAELDRREALYRQNPDDVFTWDEVETFVRRKR